MKYTDEKQFAAANIFGKKSKLALWELADRRG